MGTSVARLMGSAGVTPTDVVRWGHSVPLDQPGIYVVALTDDSLDANDSLVDWPIRR
jgi:hypothetical protein